MDRFHFRREEENDLLLDLLHRDPSLLIFPGRGLVNSFHELKNDCSAWLGLVPRQASSGCKKARREPISKSGDRLPCTLLTHGARSVVRLADRRTDPLGEWICRLKTERGTNKAVVALASKTARFVRVLLLRDQEYKKLASRENKSFYKEEKEAALPPGSARGGSTVMTERVRPRPQEPVAGNDL